MEAAKKVQKAPAVPFHVQLSKWLDEADVTNVDVARRLGYSRPNIIAMMRTGSMKVPLNRIAELADILKMNRLTLLKAALTEYDPALLETLNKMMGKSLVSPNELAVVELLRSTLSGSDIDLTQNDEFVMGLQALAGRAAAKQAQMDLRPSPESKVRENSKVTRLNQEINDLLTRQAHEREKVYAKLAELVGASVMNHRRAA